MKLRNPLLAIFLALALGLSLMGCSPNEEPVPEIIPETIATPATVPTTAATEEPVPTVPEEVLPPPCPVDHMFYDQEETGKVQILSYTVQETEETYHFFLKYTASEALTLEGYLDTENSRDTFLEAVPCTEVGENSLEFELPKTIDQEYKNLYLFFHPETNENIVIAMPFPVQLRMTSGNPVGEPIRPGYLLNRKWKSDAYQIHDCFLQKLDNGYYRYTLDMTLPKRAFFSVHFLTHTAFSETFVQYTVNGRHQYVFDIAEEDVWDSREITILICEEKSRYENLITIPNGTLKPLTDGNPVGEPASLALSRKGIGECTLQKLDNGYYRYTLTFPSKENTLISLFDPPNGDLVSYRFLTSPENGQDSFTFDLDAETAETIPELTLLIGNGFTLVIKNDIRVLDATPEPQT